MSVILSSIKTQLGEESDSFNAELLIHINDALFDVKSLGAGKTGVKLVATEETTYDDLFESDETQSAIESFIYLTVKLLFDPPLTDHATKAIERNLEKKRWLICSANDEKEGFPYESEDS